MDEVQTGISRTGTFLACEQYGIRPHLITLAKGLGAGLPIGAILMDETTAPVFQAGHHGSTFGGNPVVCAGALEVLNQVTEKAFLTEVRHKAEYMRRELTVMPNVTDVLGLGLMFSLSLSEGLLSAEIAKKCVENGLLILTAKTKLRIMPPLNISFSEIDTGLSILRQCLSAAKSV